MPAMPLDRGRTFQGQKQVVIFRSTGGESVWMEVSEAKRTVARLPSEWSKEPFGGQTYAAPKDPWIVEVARNGGNFAGPLERPVGW